MFSGISYIKKLGNFSRTDRTDVTKAGKREKYVSEFMNCCTKVAKRSLAVIVGSQAGAWGPDWESFEFRAASGRLVAGKRREALRFPALKARLRKYFGDTIART
jgi:hypothetical protein